MTSYVGYQFGNYKLTTSLGAGTFGDVYLGEHIYDKTLAAIKVLKTRLTDPKDLKEFINEARSFRFRHPHIVQLLDFGIANADMPFLVMDYAPGGSLSQRHPHGEQLLLDVIVNYVKQIASALQYAHDQHVIHRDVKPENMLLGKEKAILISDFGIAVVVHSTRSGTGQNIAGTPFYMAPEQFRGRAEPASDQYALGILVYEWICGVRPFTADAPFPEERFLQLGYQHNHVPPPLLSQKISFLPTTVEHVILKALAKEPKERFSRIEEFAQALADAWHASNEKTKQPQSTILPTASSLDTLVVMPISPQEQTRKRDMVSKLADIAQGLRRQGRMEKALEAYKQMLKLEPTSLEALNGKGLLLFQLGKHQEGLDLLDEALKLVPDDTFTLENKANLLIQSGKDREGVVIFDALVKNALNALAPWIAARKAKALIQRADTLRQMNLNEDAIKLYDEVLLINREYSLGLEKANSDNQLEESYRHPYEARAKALYDIGNYEETVKSCDEILRLSALAKRKPTGARVRPNHGARRLDEPEPMPLDNTHLLKAQALTQLGRFEEALASYRQLSWPSSGSERQPIAWLLEKLGKYSEAIEEYEQAYRESPQDKDLLMRKGNCLLMLGSSDRNKYKDALNVFDIIIGLDPTNWNVWRSKGVAFERLAEYESALSSYDRAIQFSPPNRGLLKRKAEVLTHLAKFEEALDIYKAIQDFP